MDLVLLAGGDLRRILPRAWRPFFGRFGNTTEVQARTIPAVLAGQNVIVAAPTASGKTEAVVAPVAELHVAQHWPGLAVLYLVPTRALGNDLLSRLEGPLGEMFLKCVLKHGDRPTLPDGEINWLITTPESLDSLLCRRPILFKTLRAVILDEIHLLDGTYRGDQLRILLGRLKRLSSTPPLAVHMLSATLSDPRAVACRYTDEFQVIMVEGPRPIRAHLLQTHKEVFHLAQTQRWRKLLCFCNTRQSVEETAGRLKAIWSPYPVMVHHGSLDRHQREDAEEVMKQNSVAVCVATSTLEFGIDIGDIDLVVLAEPPWSLESLQQRVGRGSRRSGTIQAAAIYQTEDERAVLELMFEAAKSGSYRSVVYKPDLSVVAQQIISLLYQFRAGLSRKELLDLVGVLGTQDENAAILRYLKDKGYCLEIDEASYPSTELIDLGDKGNIHSNIPDHNDYRVINSDTGQQVGRIRGTFDEVFLLAGQSWKVIAVQGDEILVRRSAQSAAAAHFGIQRNVGRFHYLLPPELRDAR